MRNRCCYFLVALFFFHHSLSISVDSTLRGSITRNSVKTNIALLNNSSVPSNFCGEFSTTFGIEKVYVDLTYIFHGVENSVPTSFERVQTCQSIVNNDTLYSEVQLLGLLDFNMTCEISHFSNPMSYIIRRLDVFFGTEENRSFFNCSDSYPLKQYIPIESLSCSSEVIHNLTSWINANKEMSVFNYNNKIEVEDVFGTVDLLLINKDVCEMDVVSVVGSFFAFVLVGIFLFLIVYAYNNNRKSSKYIGNGIDVQAEHVISKPFSCAINPYSKKVKEIPVTTPSNEVVSSVEIDTIMINQGGHHSSFYMM